MGLVGLSGGTQMVGREVFLPRGVPAGPGFGIPVQDHGWLVGGQKCLFFLYLTPCKNVTYFFQTNTVLSLKGVFLCLIRAKTDL